MVCRKSGFFCTFLYGKFRSKTIHLIQKSTFDLRKENQIHINQLLWSAFSNMVNHANQSSFISSRSVLYSVATQQNYQYLDLKSHVSTILTANTVMCSLPARHPVISKHKALTTSNLPTQNKILLYNKNLLKYCKCNVMLVEEIRYFILEDLLNIFHFSQRF